MNISLRLAGVLGFLLFLVLFLLTYGVPKQLEDSAKGFLKSQVEKEVREKYQDITNSGLADKAAALAAKFGLEQQQLQKDIENNLPEKIAAVMASMCGYDCEKKKLLAESITQTYLDKIKNLQVAEDTLGNIIKNQYLKVLENLKQDLRIFLGVNASLFFLIIVISFFKPQAMLHLFLPTVLLLVATVMSSGIYLFGQDWFYTIIYNDYMGWGYLAYVIVIFGFLMDVVFNSGRITTEIINRILEALGSALSAMPC